MPIFRLFSALMCVWIKPFDRFQQTFAMDHAQNMDIIAFNFIDQTIAVNKTFSHVRVIKFRYLSARLWLFWKAIS